MSSHFQRREFLKLAGAAGLAPSFGGAGKPVRIGLVGVGNRGTGLVKILLDVPGVEIPAICDINEEHLQMPRPSSKKPVASGRKDMLAARKTTGAWWSARIWTPS